MYLCMYIHFWCCYHEPVCLDNFFLRFVFVLTISVVFFLCRYFVLFLLHNCFSVANFVVGMLSLRNLPRMKGVSGCTVKSRFKVRPVMATEKVKPIVVLALKWNFSIKNAKTWQMKNQTKLTILAADNVCAKMHTCKMFSFARCDFHVCFDLHPYEYTYVYVYVCK